MHSPRRPPPVRASPAQGAPRHACPDAATVIRRRVGHCLGPPPARRGSHRWVQTRPWATANESKSSTRT
eukprot:scaffold518_cov388-Prasinococcus_capsulatus_cf.AAC.5